MALNQKLMETFEQERQARELAEKELVQARATEAAEALLQKLEPFGVESERVDKVVRQSEHAYIASLAVEDLTFSLRVWWGAYKNRNEGYLSAEVSCPDCPWRESHEQVTPAIAGQLLLRRQEHMEKCAKDRAEKARREAERAEREKAERERRLAEEAERKRQQAEVERERALPLLERAALLRQREEAAAAADAASRRAGARQDALKQLTEQVERVLGVTLVPDDPRVEWVEDEPYAVLEGMRFCATRRSYRYDDYYHEDRDLHLVRPCELCGGERWLLIHSLTSLLDADKSANWRHTCPESEDGAEAVVATVQARIITPQEAALLDALSAFIQANSYSE